MVLRSNGLVADTHLEKVHAAVTRQELAKTESSLMALDLAHRVVAMPHGGALQDLERSVAGRQDHKPSHLCRRSFPKGIQLQSSRLDRI